jgi:hypothetical protein
MKQFKIVQGKQAKEAKEAKEVDGARRDELVGMLAKYFGSQATGTATSVSKLVVELVEMVGEEELKSLVMEEIRRRNLDPKGGAVGPHFLDAALYPARQTAIATFHAALVRKLVNPLFYDMIERSVPAGVFVSALLTEPELSVTADSLALTRDYPNADELETLINDTAQIRTLDFEPDEVLTTMPHEYRKPTSDRPTKRRR